MLMKIKQIINEILSIAPLELQQGYDNSGLQVGNIDQEVKNIAITLDVDLGTITKAVKKNANLIISHHPMIFKPLKNVSTRNSTGRRIFDAIKNDICIYSCHTNFDSAFGGLNDILAKMVGVGKLSPLVKHEDQSLCKLVVFIPIGYEKRVKDALFAAGAGTIGAYLDCSFSQRGRGTFAAPQDSNPFIGERGKDNSVNETRLEVIMRKSLTDKAIAVLMSVHPYEEPAFDIYPLMGVEQNAGIGRVGELREKTTLGALTELVKDKLKIKKLRCVGKEKSKVKKVAICTGSGGSLIGRVIAKGADVYITGDVKYHEAKQAEESGLNIIDAGHFATEVIFTDFMKKHLTNFINANGVLVKVFSDKGNDPFVYM